METLPPYNAISQPYSPEQYQNIKSTLRAAVLDFEKRNGQDLINTEIRDCFLKHRVEDKFSATLIHRHFDILPSERNVEDGGRAIASSHLDGIYPSSWMIRNGKLYPYEYKKVKTACPPAEFVHELAEILEKKGYEDMIGFQVYEDGIVGFESTVDNVSTTIDKNERDLVDEDLQGMMPASWAFYRC